MRDLMQQGQGAPGFGAEAAGEDLAAEAEELGVAEVDSVGRRIRGGGGFGGGEEGLEVVEIGPEDGRE